MGLFGAVTFGGEVFDMGPEHLGPLTSPLAELLVPIDLVQFYFNISG